MKDELAIQVARTSNGADPIAQGENIANAAAHIVAGRRFINNNNSLSDANMVDSDSPISTSFRPRLESNLNGKDKLNLFL